MIDDGGALSVAMYGRASSPVLVGRVEQMAALEDAFTSVRQGRPASVLLGGEAGVGKSRLVDEFTTSARRAGARVLVGGCMQLGADGLAFAPFTAMLRDLVHDMGAEAFAAMLPGRATRELARLLPELGTSDLDDAGPARARLFEEVLAALEQLGRRSPVVLVIEDAHWADRSSRDLLTFLIGNQRAIGGLMSLVTFRSDELHRTHPVRPLLATLERVPWVERLEVPRLSRQDTAGLAESMLGQTVSENAITALFRRTQGNPLFIESLLCCDGDLSRDLPDSLRDLLLASVHRLPEPTQEVLRAASASGGVTGHALLAAVTGMDDDALTSALRPAVTANVLRAEASGYAFRHELIREAVHDDLLPGEHGRVHNKFAEAIDADNALVPPGRAAVETAHHWASGHDVTRALTAAWRAAACAGRAVAAAERLDLLARVLELWDQVPDAAELIGADHARVLEEAATVAEDADEFERGVALATSALKELDPDTEPVRVALLLEARARYKLKTSRRKYVEDFEEALRLVPADLSPRARMRILLTAARCPSDGPREYNRAQAEEALELARRDGDPASEAQAMLTLAMFDADSGQQADPDGPEIELIHQARTLAASVGAHEQLLLAAVNESHLLEGAGAHERAFEAARDGIASADAQRLSRTSGSLLSINEAEPLLALGRWDAMLSVVDGALDMYYTPVYGHRAIIKILKGNVFLARGDLNATAQAIAGADDLIRCAAFKYQNGFPLGRLQILFALAEDPAQAVGAAAQFLDTHDLTTGNPRYVWPLLTAMASACAAALRQPASAGDAARRADVTVVAERLRTVAEKLEAFGPVQRAHQLTYQAADLLIAGTERTAAWDEAAQAWSALSEPYPLAQTLLQAAESALAEGDRETATERLRQAAPIAAELGAIPLSDAISALARRARIFLGDGGPGRSGTGQAGAGTDQGASTDGSHAGLTERELEVIRLVALGRSNREIATELFISPKTASVHVSNILGKLGVSTRTEAAGRAHALGLLDG
jgi:predicted ATPase/DNA-binding CsgD family transcriptional regulator